MLEPLPQECLEGIREGGLVQRLDDYERRLLREALEEAGGNRTRAASALGISRFALLRRLQRHALE
ncbi:MAG TPA: helix-turn-helix domain-containing protein [Synergistaceae bacterium]|nr:helix-turn-helix domain-containing protein [Synergistaceae bacterium]